MDIIKIQIHIYKQYICISFYVMAINFLRKKNLNNSSFETDNVSFLLFHVKN